MILARGLELSSPADLLDGISLRRRRAGGHRAVAGARYSLASSAQLAQLVEHFHGKEGVIGSSPMLGFRVAEPIG